MCSNVPKSPKLIQGNVRENNFVDVWENGFNYFRDYESCYTGRCEKCEHYSLCFRDSLHTWNFEDVEPCFCMLNYGFELITVSNSCISCSLLSVIQKIKGNKERISDSWIKAQSLSKDIVIITSDAFKSILNTFTGNVKQYQLREYVLCFCIYTEILKLMKNCFFQWHSQLYENDWKKALAIILNSLF